MKIKSAQDLVQQALSEISTLSPLEVKKLNEEENCILIDIRDIRELWSKGTIENSLHIPRGMIEFWLDPSSNYYKPEKFKEDKKIILFCAAGFRSALATKSLVDMGYTNVAHVSEGFEGLKNAGAKVIEKDKK